MRNWTVRADKMKRRKNQWSTKQDVTKVKATRQFKQLKTQTLRFNREASSPAARMVLMKSNKRFKPGDYKRAKGQQQNKSVSGFTNNQQPAQ